MDHGRALLPGTMVAGDPATGGWHIERMLGEGGFGITYMARHAISGVRVALKEYLPAGCGARVAGTSMVRAADGRAGEIFRWGLNRFIQEAETLARLDHPSIVRVSGLFQANGTAYMALGYEDGGTFTDWLRGLGRRPTQAEMDRILWPLLDALRDVHSLALLHRDIKPDNIMMRADPMMGGAPVLIDFGAAKIALVSHSRVGGNGGIAGSLAVVSDGYSPPEQYAAGSNLQGPWTDIYALAATVYFAMTGAPPVASSERVVHERYAPLAGMNTRGEYRPAFLAGIDQALSLKREARPQSALELRRALGVMEPVRVEVAVVAPSLEPMPVDATEVRTEGVPSEIRASDDVAVMLLDIAGSITDEQTEAPGPDRRFEAVEQLSASEVEEAKTPSETGWEPPTFLRTAPLDPYPWPEAEILPRTRSKKWVIGTVVSCALMVLLGVEHNRVVRVAPSAAWIYDGLGISVNIYGLWLRNVKVDWIEKEKQTELEVRGEVHNHSRADTRVPSVIIVMRDRAGANLFHSVATVGTGIVSSGGFTRFVARIPTLPVGIASVAVHFPLPSPVVVVPVRNPPNPPAAEKPPQAAAKTQNPDSPSGSVAGGDVLARLSIEPNELAVPKVAANTKTGASATAGSGIESVLSELKQRFEQPPSEPPMGLGRAKPDSQPAGGTGAGATVTAGQKQVSSATIGLPKPEPVARAANLSGDPTRTRFVADLSQAVSANVFTLADPYRVIIELPQINFQFAQGQGAQSVGLVKGYRFGVFAPGRSRIVLDVTGPVIVAAVDVKPDNASQTARLSIDLVPTDRTTFLAGQSRQFASSATAKKIEVPTPVLVHTGAPNPADGSQCKAWSASFGGEKSVLIRVNDGQITHFTALQVNAGREKDEATAYIAAYARGGRIAGDFTSADQAIKKAFELCPSAPAPAPMGLGGGGYVAVLSSQRDRAAALRIFADLAEKYPEQLRGKQPEVQEANMGEKGVWQRLVVGPPGAQQAAKELCVQLKAAGHGGDCWAKPY